MEDGRSRILDRLGAILKDKLKLDGQQARLEEDVGLLGRGIGLDSIEVLELVGAIEEEFGLTLDEDEIEERHFATVGAVVRFIEERMGTDDR